MTAIDDGRLEQLVARGERAERRAQTITGGDLQGLAEGLGTLECTIAQLRERIARTEADADGRPDSVAALAASLRLTEAEAEYLRERLYDRLVELGVDVVDASPATPGHGTVRPHHPAGSPHARPHPHPHPHPHHTAAPPVHVAIRAAGGRFEAQIVHAARLSRLPVALVCAVIEQESGFRNVFGHDAVANPVKSPPHGVLEVTRERYERYLRHRRLGQGNQGVGPMQLTTPSFQDRADAYGGCWRPGPNIRVGCEVLADNIARLGLRAGVQAYNRAGAGFGYADAVLALERKWRARLGRAHAGPRTFRLAKPLMRGEDVRRFQDAVNRRLAALRVDEHVAEDGEFGRETRRAARQAAYALGASGSDWAHGITPELQRLIATPSRRTPQQLARSQRRRGWLARLRKRASGPLRLRAYKQAKRLLDAHVRESGGNNRGKVVDEIILANHGAVGEPWCGDFVAWCYRKAGSKSVNRNWAGVKKYLPMSGLRRTGAPLKGDLVRYNFDHIGVFAGWCDAAGRPLPHRGATHLKAIEGNTGHAGAVSDSASGGDGVYLKIRSRTLVTDFIRVLR